MRQLDLFFRHQKADGQLPIAVLDNRIGYGQIQECVSIGGLCLDALRLCPDEEKLADWYSGLTLAAVAGGAPHDARAGADRDVLRLRYRPRQ